MICFLPMKTEKKTWFVMYLIFLPHAGIAHDITNTNCWAQNGRLTVGVFELPSIDFF